MLIVLLAIGLPLTVAADARTDRLVDLLRASGNYRVRVQSAQSLGRIRDPETVPALVEALEDEHPAVRAAAAQALGRIGSPDAIAPLRRLAAAEGQPPAVVRLAERAIEQIERIAAASGRSKVAAPSGKARFYIGVGEMGNTTGQREGEVEDTLARFIREALDGAAGVKLAPAGEHPRETSKIIKREKLVGYYIQGSVNRLDEANGQISASVSIMVLSNPGRDLRMMLSGRGSASIPGAQKLTPAQTRNLQDFALKAAVQGAMQRLLEQLASQ